MLQVIMPMLRPVKRSSRFIFAVQVVQSVGSAFMNVSPTKIHTDIRTRGCSLMKRAKASLSLERK